MKLKTVYICNACAHQSSQWLGRCPQCEAWNSFAEDVINVGKTPDAGKNPLSRAKRTLTASAPTSLAQRPSVKSRIITGIGELDTVLGGGIVEGSLLLLAGEPGIGKSTITLQICGALAEKLPKILYISGEESVDQIIDRAHRLHITQPNIDLVTENNIEEIQTLIEKHKPSFVVIDSVQVLSSQALDAAGGSITQVRYCTEVLMHLAKLQNIPMLLVSHVTKEGTLAGPKVLEHLVDAILYLEGDRYHRMRLLRSTKNRFGSTHEVGVFEMKESGLMEVENPSQLFLEGRRDDAPGSCLTVTIEGTRPFIVEIQALTTITAFGYPKRSANGFDLNRLQMIIAVLQEHGKLDLANQDIFVNVVGGISIEEPAADLAVALAIASSYRKTPLPTAALALGEVGLSGELRVIPDLEKRLKEAKKLGYTNVIASSSYHTLIEALGSVGGSVNKKRA